MKYCILCGQNVEPVKKFSIGWFLFDCLTIVGGGIYILYWAFAKSKTCPMCGGSQFEAKRNGISSQNGSSTLSKMDIMAKNIEDGKLKAKDKLQQARDRGVIAEAKLAEAKARNAESRQVLKDQSLARKQAREEKKQLKAQQKLERVKGN